MFCPFCGSQCTEEAKFCPSCGRTLSQESPVFSDAASVPSQTTDAPNVPSENTFNPNPAGGYDPNAYYSTPFTPSAEPQKSGTAVLVLGIVATVINSGLGCLCGCLGSLPGLVCAIIGIVLGFKAKKEYAPGETNKKNDAGVILCFVSLGIMLLMTILNAVLGGLMALYNG